MLLSYCYQQYHTSYVHNIPYSMQNPLMLHSYLNKIGMLLYWCRIIHLPFWLVPSYLINSIFFNLIKRVFILLIFSPSSRDTLDCEYSGCSFNNDIILLSISSKLRCSLGVIYTQDCSNYWKYKLCPVWCI